MPALFSQTKCLSDNFGFPNRSFQKTNRLLAIISPYLDRGFFNRMMVGAEQAAHQHGYMLLVGVSQDDPQRELELIKRLIERQVDGYLLVPASNKSRAVEIFHKNNIPLVLLERRINTNIIQVEIDHFAAMYQAAEFLIKNGHRRIAFLGPNGNLGNIVSRRRAFLKAISDYKLDRSKQLMILDSLQYPEDGYQIAREVLKEADISAILVGQGHPAKGVMQAVKEHSLKVPDDISVLVYGVHEWAEAYHPSLCHVQLPDFKMGEVGVELLIEQIKSGTRQTGKITLQGALIEGNSVKNVND